MRSTLRPLLEVGSLTVRFPTPAGAVVAVDDVSFDIYVGETLGLVGESGSGKSLSALAIAGLTPDGADVRTRDGIRWRSRRIDGPNNRLLARLRGRRIGTVFQEPAGCLNPLMTIGRQVSEAIHPPRRADRSFVPKRVADLLVEVGLDPAVAARYPHQMSGGQQQRAMIAMALAGDPALLIADEPTTALDVTIQAQIIGLLRQLQLRRRLALLFISHDLALVAAIADRVMVMHRGRIIEQGPATTVFERPQEPYTRALLAARPGHGAMPPRLPTLDDMLAGRSPASPPERPPIGRPVLTIRNLTVNYPGGNWLARSISAVDSVSLTLCAGETLGLVGESGSGKSTIANAIVGLCPSSGEISLFGQTLMRDRSPGHPRCQIVFQDSNGSLNPRLTVARILGEPLDRRRLYRGSVRRKHLVSLLAEVRLAEELLDRYPHELSGGQRQRVNIARALALDPEILICDEIVSALDVTVQAQVLNLLKDIQAARGLALLFISHDLAVVRFMADRVAVMAQGRIVETGPTSDVLDRPRHPYTQTLMSAIPQDPTVEAA